MSRDPRKAGAFDSGMRGREKPKIQTGNTDATKGPDGGTGSESKMTPGATVGTPKGVDLSAYTSGMRGIEKPKQAAASGDANMFAEEGSKMGGENKQGPSTIVGHPSGHSDAASGARKGIKDSALQSRVTDTRKLGIAGNNTEAAAAGNEPSGEGILGEEDDTHINIRIPKASLKKKQSGMAGSI